MCNDDQSEFFIRAAGGLIWRSGISGKEIAIIHRPRYDDWTLPKGKLEPGEDWKTAALREVQEETGLDVECLEFAGTVEYYIRDIPKTVMFWHMQLKENFGGFIPNSEVDQLMWVSLPEALEKLSHVTEKEFLSKSVATICFL